MRFIALCLTTLWAGVALAQAPTPTPVPATGTVEAPSKALRQAIPQLYFLKLQGILQDAVIQPLAHRYELKVSIRVKLDESGAITKWSWVQSPGGKPVFTRAVEKLMTAYGPTGTERLPMATDPALREQITHHGFLCKLKFNPNPAYDRARRAAQRDAAKAPASAPASGK